MRNAPDGNTDPQDRGRWPHPGPRFAIEVANNGLSVRSALKTLEGALRPFGLSIEETGSVQLVVAEILNNIVEHGYPAGQTNGQIKLEGHFEADGLHLAIRDNGRALPGGALPEGMRQTVDVELHDLPEGGFGWFLIRDIARDLDYRRDAKGNYLSLRIRVAVPSLN